MKHSAIRCGVCKKKFKNRTAQESHKEYAHRDKLSCSKYIFKSESDQKLDTHIIIYHFKVNFSGAPNPDKFECNECDDYFEQREELVRHVRKR